MFHIKAPVLLITTAEPKNIKLFFFYVCNRFRMGSQIQYLLLFGIIPRPPSASCFLPDFILFNFVFSPTLQKSGHFLSQHIYTYRRDMIVPGTYCVSFFLLVQVCLHVCGYQGGGCKAQMLTLSSAWIGRWQMALRGACDTGVSEQAGEHMKGRLCRHVASGCQQGCDEVRPVA